MDFRYQPLKDDEIRLLKPVPYLPNSPPAFKVIHASISSKPSYSALSYAWGPPGNVCTITVDGHRFEIRRNLHDALQQILQSKLIHRHLWVDAVCINQGSDEAAKNEKSVQITRMRQIYEKAARVVVWLGVPPNHTQNRLAFAMMEHIYNRAMTLRRAFYLRGVRPWWWPRKGRSSGDFEAYFLNKLAPAKDKTISDVPGSGAHQAWLGIACLWESSWWKRTWTLQEATIPEKKVAMYWFPFKLNPTLPTRVHFLFGDQRTNWERLILVSIVAGYMSLTNSNSSLVLTAGVSFGQMKNLHISRSFRKASNPLELMQIFRFTDCSDPRDKVYAPLCLAPDDIRHAIRPDYAGKTASELYTDVVRYHLLQDPSSLDFLGYAMHPEGSSVARVSEAAPLVLPSWVPNFLDKLDIWPIPKMLHKPVDLERRRLAVTDRRSVPSFGGEQSPPYHPLAVTEPAPSIEGLALCISGVFIDIVKDIMFETIPGKDREAVLEVAREKGRKWRSETNNEYFTGETFLNAQNRTLVFDLIFDDSGRAAERGGKFDHQLQKKSPAELSAVEIKYQTQMRQARLQAGISRLSALSRKHYILAVPRTTKVGDLIWAFVGGRALYILRPIDRDTSHYTFIGECYVHGLMDGEVDRLLHTREAKMEQIRLL